MRRRGTTGLYHLAILYPTRADLGRALKGLIRMGCSWMGGGPWGERGAVSARSG